MCFSGKCQFEQYDGGCRIGDLKKFKTKYGYDACLIGGTATCPEDEVWIESNPDTREKIIKKYYKDQKEG